VNQGVFVKLRFKFVLPINLILVIILGASLAWEWWRLERNELGMLRTRLDEEARFVHAAAKTFGVTPRFADFLEGFCHATDAAASPEHQVALVNSAGELVASAAAHAHQPINPAGLAAMTEGFWTRSRGDDSYLIRVSSDGAGVWWWPNRRDCSGSESVGHLSATPRGSWAWDCSFSSPSMTDWCSFAARSPKKMM
jgi:hypothetical protein